jgi:enoyl-CoA hydratase
MPLVRSCKGSASGSGDRRIELAMDFGPFHLETDAAGVGLVIFGRPPVNAFSLAVYEALGELTDAVSGSEDVRVLVIGAPDGARAWCGGADVRDFVAMNAERRKERYEFINASLPRFAALDRPVIAAVNSHAVGFGTILAGLCDLRVAADSATFACPEIDYGLVGGGAGLFSALNMPEAVIREMLYTGRRFSAAEMYRCGLLNYVVPVADVMTKSVELAHAIARKSLPALKARKLVFTAIEGLTWHEAYLTAQEASGRLVGGPDAEEGVKAFLEHRPAQLLDE